jgi:ABC-type nitrate/sulfonate/bicarbonate transport system permease component
MASALGWVAIRVYPLVLLLVGWQLLVTFELIGNAFVLPPPSAVWRQAVALWGSGQLPSTALVTLRRILAAFGLALLVGVTLGLLLGRIRSVRLAARPLVSFFFPTPKVAIYPALVILFGLGTASKIALGFAEAVFPIILATVAAASQVEPRLVWSALGLGTSHAATFWKVVLPAALPGILTGARIGLVGAIIGVFIGELIVGSDGLGHTMGVAYRTLATADMYVAVVTVSVIGFVLDRLFLATRRRLLTWSTEDDT